MGTMFAGAGARALRVALAFALAALHAPAHAQSGSSPVAPPPAGEEQISPFGDGKRVALLIGQSDYANAPLPGAAADVAMLAGQLNAAGFDVESAGILLWPAHPALRAHRFPAFSEGLR